MTVPAAVVTGAPLLRIAQAVVVEYSSFSTDSVVGLGVAVELLVRLGVVGLAVGVVGGFVVESTCVVVSSSFPPTDAAVGLGVVVGLLV